MSLPLVEGRDYYVENGLYVFTAEYLLRRGHCCASSCRHCPYGFRKPAVAPAQGDVFSEPRTQPPRRAE